MIRIFFPVLQPYRRRKKIHGSEYHTTFQYLDSWRMAAVRMSVKRVRRIARSEAKRVIDSDTEVKATDQAQALVGVPNTVTLGPLTNVAQGTTGVTRAGDQVKARSIFFRMSIRWNPAGDPSQIVRVAVLLDVESAGLNPSPNGVVSSVWEGAAGTLIVEAQLNHLTRKRFLVLWNKSFCLSSARSAFFIAKSIKLRGEITYLDATANATSLGTNHVFMAFWSDKILNTPTIAFTSRFRYTDG